MGEDDPSTGPRVGEADSTDPESMLSDMIPAITFNPAKVRAYLEEGFDWLAEKFDSGHWRLTEKQADMLAEPTAELLGGVWTKVAEYLPELLTSTPGATAFVFACAFVLGPKIGQQVAISRQKKTAQAPRASVAPIREQRPYPQGAPVGPITSQVERMEVPE